MQKRANGVSLEAVHTHTHTHTHTSIFREIRRVANKATLCCVDNRLFVVLYEGKNKVLGIACFLRGKNNIKMIYTKYKFILCTEKKRLKTCTKPDRIFNKQLEIGGVE